MAKLVLDEVLSGFNLVKINENFQAIADELQANVLYRNNPSGEPNQMGNAIDMNSNKLLNVADGTVASDGVNLAQVIDIANGGTGGSGIGDVVGGDLAVLGSITSESAWTLQSETVGFPDFVITNGSVVGTPTTTMYLSPNTANQLIAFGAGDASDVMQTVILDTSDASTQVPGPVRWEYGDKGTTKDYMASWDELLGVPTFLMAPENPGTMLGTQVSIAGTDSSGTPNIMSILAGGILDLDNITQISLDNLVGGDKATLIFGNFGGPLLSLDTAQNNSSFGITTRTTGGVAKTNLFDGNGYLTLAQSTPTLAAHAASKAYVDLVAGGGGGGAGDLLADGTVPLTATWDLNGFGITTSLAPTSGNELCNKTYVDSVAGSPTITSDLDMNQYDIVNMYETEWENQTTGTSNYIAQVDDVLGINIWSLATTTNSSAISLTSTSSGGVQRSTVFGADGDVTNQVGYILQTAGAGGLNAYNTTNGGVGYKAQADGSARIMQLSNINVEEDTWVAFNRNAGSDFYFNNTKHWEISTNGVQLAAGTMLAPGGSAGVPTYSFTGDTDTGVFSSVAGAVDIASNGGTVGTFSAFGLAMSGAIDLGNNVIQAVLDPTTDAHVGDRGYNDTRYQERSEMELAGIAVAGGKVTSTGSGSQSVTNTFGVTSCSISSDHFIITLNDAITVNEDMVVVGNVGTGLTQLSLQWIRISDTVFWVYLNNSTPAGLVTSGLWFSFMVYDAGR